MEHQPLYQRVLQLYDANLFVDAHRLTAELWSDRRAPERLDTASVVLASRLARRLGSDQYAEALSRYIRARDPEHPEVLYFCRPTWGRPGSSWNRLLQFEARPKLGADDPALEASWAASHALALTEVRDFETAWARIEDAESFGIERPWIASCAAYVALGQERWTTALEHAERAWILSPGLTWAGAGLASALGALGRPHEAATRLLDWVEATPQNVALLEIGVRLALDTFERQPGPQARALLARADAASPNLESLAPLADRTTRRRFAALRADLAHARGDRKVYLHHARQVRFPFYDATAKNLEANPEGERFVLPHRHVRQLHNTCLPASVTCALSCFEVDVDQAALSEELTYAGTPMWRILHWAERKGFVTRAFSATAEATQAVLRARLPFVFSTSTLSNRHACCAVGLDEGVGTVLVHDPGRNGLSEYLLERFGQTEVPVGPEAFVIVPASRAEALRALELPYERETETIWATEEALAEAGLDAARAALRPLSEASPKGVITRYLEAQVNLHDDDPEAAEALLEGLLQEWPRSTPLQSLLLRASSARHDPVAQRRLLEAVLDAKPLPGVDGSTGWIHPEPDIYVRLADLLRSHADGAERAERLLDKALWLSPGRGLHYHVLADLYAAQGRMQDALLAFRFASTLDVENEHFAEAYAQAAHALGRTEDGLRWLENRAGLATEAGGGLAIATWVETLEAFGRPGRALEVMRDAMARRGEDAELSAFAAVFFARHGADAASEAAMAVCRAKARPGLRAKVEARMAAVRDDLPAALAHAETWHAEEPWNAEARAMVLSLLDGIEGPAAAEARVKTWHEAHPSDRVLQDMLHEAREGSGDDEGRQAYVKTRLEEDPKDLWALREQAFISLQHHAQATAEDRPSALAALEAAVAAVVAADRAHPARHGLEAELAILHGDLERGLEAFGAALKVDPDYGYGLTRLFELTTRLPEAARARVIELLDDVYGGATPGRGLAGQATNYIAERFGLEVAEQAVQRWTGGREDLPDLVHALAEAHLEIDGSADCARALLPRLERATGRYPLHSGLGLMRARVLRRAGRDEEAYAVLEALHARHPGDRYVLGAWVTVLRDRGDLEEAIDCVRRVVDRGPARFSFCMMLSELLQVANRTGEAVVVLEAAAERCPGIMNLWEQRVDLLFELGRSKEALEVVEALVARYQDGGYPQLVKARALYRLPGVNRQEVLAAYQQSLELSPWMWEAANEAVDYLVAQGEPARATALLDRFEAQNGATLYQRGARLLIARAGGDRKQAFNDLLALLKEEPDYQYAWGLLLSWAAEDEAWAAGRRALEGVGPVVGADSDFEVARLGFLRRAGTDEDELVEAWNRLAARFPHDRSVRTRRIEVLLELGRSEEAKVELRLLPPGMRRAARAEALRVSAHAALREADEALEAFGRLLELNVSHARVFYVAWQALAEANLTVRGVEAVIEALDSEAPLTDGHVDAMLDVLMDIRATHLVRKLVDALTMGPLDARRRFWLGGALLKLVDLGEPDEVLTLAEVRPELFVPLRAPAGDEPGRASSQVGLWHAKGYALVVAGRSRQAYQWLSSWADQPRLEQHAVLMFCRAACYLGEWEAIRAAAWHGLTNLEQSGCGGVLLVDLVEASLCLKDTEAAVRDFEAFGFHLASLDAHDPHRELLEAAYEALTTEDHRRISELHTATHRAREQTDWNRYAWPTVLSARLPWWRRLWLQLVG